MLSKDKAKLHESIGLYGTVGLSNNDDYRLKLNRLLKERDVHNLILYDSRFSGDSWTEENWRDQEGLKDDLPYILFYSGFCGTNPTINLPVETLLDAFIAEVENYHVITFWNNSGYEKRDRKIFDRAMRLVSDYHQFIEVVSDPNELFRIAEKKGEVFVYGNGPKARSLGVEKFTTLDTPQYNTPCIFSIEKPEVPFQKLSGYSILELLMHISKYPERTIGVIDTNGFENCKEAYRILTKIRETLEFNYPDAHIYDNLEKAADFLATSRLFNKLRQNLAVHA